MVELGDPHDVAELPGLINYTNSEIADPSPLSPSDFVRVISHDYSMQ